MVVDASEDKNEERRQVRASGCVVRLGVSKASPLVGELDGGTIVSINRAATAIASADEPLRVKMTKPLQGWVSFKCLGAAPDERGDPDAAPAVNQPADPAQPDRQAVCAGELLAEQRLPRRIGGPTRPRAVAAAAAASRQRRRSVKARPTKERDSRD